MVWREREVTIRSSYQHRAPSGDLYTIAEIDLGPGKPTRYVFASELS